MFPMLYFTNFILCVNVFCTLQKSHFFKQSDIFAQRQFGALGALNPNRSGMYFTQLALHCPLNSRYKF